MKKNFSLASLMLLAVIATATLASCNGDSKASPASTSTVKEEKQSTPEKPKTLEGKATALNLTKPVVEKWEDGGDCSGPGRIKVKYTVSFASTENQSAGQTVTIDECDCSDGEQTGGGKQALQNYKLLQSTSISDVVIQYTLQNDVYVPALLKIKEKTTAGQDGKPGTYQPEVIIWKKLF